MTDLFVLVSLLDIAIKGAGNVVKYVKHKVYKTEYYEIFILTTQPKVNLYDVVIGKPILFSR